MVERFDQIYTKVCDRIALYGCGTLIMLMMIYVFGHVFSRYVLRLGGIIGCYTYVGIMLVPVTYLGLAYGWYKGSYVAVDIVQRRLKGKALWWSQFVFLVMTLILFTVALFAGAVMETNYAYNIRWLAGEPGSFMIGWPWKATMVVGTFLLAVRNILDIIRMVRTGEVITRDR